VCDWRVKIPRDANRPRLEDLIQWQAEINGLPFQPEEDESLSNIIENAQAFREFLIPYTSHTAGVMSTMEEVPTQRFYLRKLEGADVLLAPESNFFRQSLHRLVPHAPEPPPILEISLSTRKPRPTKQQKLMAQLGVDNPDDLPEHLRTKTYNKRKSPSLDQRRQSTEPGAFGASQRDNNFQRSQTGTSYPSKVVQYHPVRTHSMNTSSDDTSNPFRQTATAAATLALGSPPPAFNNDLLSASPRRTIPLDYSNGLDLPTWDEGRQRERYDAFAPGDGAPTSNFDEMFALTNSADDVHDGRNASGGNGDSAMDPALFM
jgi:histone demethylase JARID1